jgi:hypothetical protein
MRTLLAYQKGYSYDSVVLAPEGCHRVCTTPEGVDITTPRWQVLAGVKKDAMPIFLHQLDENWRIFVELGGYSHIIAIVPPEDDLNARCLELLRAGLVIYESDSGRQYAAEIPAGTVVKVTDKGLFFVDKKRLAD